MNFNGYNIEKYRNCDVFHNVCDLQPKGFSRENSRNDILSIAISSRCPIVVKDETGKWFLHLFTFQMPTCFPIKSNIL